MFDPLDLWFFCGPPVENTLSGGISTYLKHPLGGHPPPCARCDRPELPGLATGLACRLSETILASPVPAGVALIPETLSSPPQPLYGALAPCEFRDDVLAGFNANYFASCCSRPGLLFDLVSFPVLSQITVVPEEERKEEARPLLFFFSFVYGLSALHFTCNASSRRRRFRGGPDYILSQRKRASATTPPPNPSPPTSSL
jgi:hypothetical protein